MAPGAEGKFLLFVLDGMADRPCPELGGRTPLEAAPTPVMDRLAREGAVGLLRTIPEGCAPGSEVANLAILAYDPRVINPGRGVLEAASMGIALGPRTLALRANLVTLEDGRMADHSAGHIASEEARELIEALNARLATAETRLHPGVSYRHLLTIEGGSAALACTPPHDILGREFAPHLPRATAPEGEAACALLLRLMAASQPILRDHPVNARRRGAGKPPAASIWPWSPGTAPRIPSLSERFGVRGAVISAVDLIRGIGVLAGMRVIAVPGATGMPDTDYEGKADAAVAALDESDLVYVHVEGTDEAGHMGDPAVKARAIEWCDRRLIGRALALLAARGLIARTRIAVLPDHFTPCALRTHDPAPVPFLIWGAGTAPAGTAAFNETAAREGSLGLREGIDFMGLLLGREARPR